jgi:DNA-binding GntR family transcriptional regulator
MQITSTKTSSQSLTEQAYERLKHMLIKLELTPGEVLSEQDLVERLGIGRTPIREALQQLAREGLINIMPRRGIVVADLNIQHQLKLVEFRRVLEGYLVSASAQHLADKDRENCKVFLKYLEATSAAPTPDIMVYVIQEYLRVICLASKNPYAANAAQLSIGLSVRFMYAYYRKIAGSSKVQDLQQTYRRSYSYFNDMFNGILSGDSKAATKAHSELMDNIENFTRAALDINLD